MMGKYGRINDFINNLGTYKLICREVLEDLDTEGIVLEHIKSGARIVLMPHEDENKVFSVAFRTPPTDSTGVAHILEHSVLCGSERFPVKEPFVELCKGSLNTFLNAMTYPDKTVYPVASCNDKDFANLMEVYLDAVFFPNIYRKEEIFRQEGWHYEQKEDTGALTINGVVYNEMKGVFSDPEQVLDTQMMKALYPDTPYAVVFGGDPDDIPTLTYEAFLDFHKKYYHPSNSYIFLYGNMDMEERLSWMDREFLSRFDKIEVPSVINNTKTFTSPLHVNAEYSVNTPEEEKDAAYFSLGCALEGEDSATRRSALKVLDAALFNTPGAPVRTALLDAGFCEKIEACVCSEMKQPYVSVMVGNAQPDKEEEFCRILTDTLKDCVKNGVQRKKMEAIISHKEFTDREADAGRTPKGLLYNLIILEKWLYDDSHIFDSLYLTKENEELRRLLDTDYYERLINEVFLENPHTVWVNLQPKTGLLAEKEAQFAKKMEEYKASLSEKELEEIRKQEKRLKEYQSTPDSPKALATIPRLTRKDIRRTVSPLHNEEKTAGGIRVIHHEIPTGKIAYFSILFRTGRLPLKKQIYVGLLADVIGLMDTKLHTYSELNDEINIETGGFTSTTMTLSKHGDDSTASGYFVMRGKTLYTKIGEWMAFLREMLFQTDFSDGKRLLELLREIKSDTESGMTSRARAFVVGRMEAYLTRNGAIDEYLSGIEYYEAIADILEHFDERKEEVAQELCDTCRLLFTADNCLLSITADAEGYEAFLKSVAVFTEVMPKEGPAEVDFAMPKLKNEGFATPGMVQYVGRAGNFVKAGHTYHAAFDVLETIMSYDYLWNRVRVKGGAYGASFSANRDGYLYFVSWRDPHLKTTLQVYEDAVEYIENFDADEAELTKYVIGTMSKSEAPRNARLEGERGMLAYILGRTEEMMNERRRKIIDVTNEDIRALAPIVRDAFSEGYCCCIGSAEKIRENAELFEKVRDLIR